MKTSKLFLFILFIFCFTTASSQLTFTWVGPANGGNWHDPVNWLDQSAVNGVPTMNDIVIIDTGTDLDIALDMMTPSDVSEMYIWPNGTIPTTVSFYELIGETATLTIFSYMEISADCSLELISAGQPVIINNYGSGFINGNVRIGGGSHKLLCSTFGEFIWFLDGSFFISDYGLNGYPFGDSASNQNSILFESGSRYIYFDGWTPFGSDASGGSMTVFHPESAFEIHDGDGSLIEFSGKTYGNIVNDSGNDVIVMGTAVTDEIFSFNTMTTLDGPLLFEGTNFDAISIDGFFLAATGGPISLQAGLGGFSFTAGNTLIAGTSPVNFLVNSPVASAFSMLVSGNSLVLDTDVNLISSTATVHNISIGGIIDCGNNVVSLNDINLHLLNTAKVLSAHSNGFEANMPGTIYDLLTTFELNSLSSQNSGFTSHTVPVGTMIINNPTGVLMDNDLNIGTLSLENGELYIGAHTLDIFGTIQYSSGYLSGDIASSILTISEPAGGDVFVNTELHLDQFIVNAVNAEVRLVGPGRLYTRNTLLQNGRLFISNADLDITQSLGYTGGVLHGGPLAGLFVGPLVDLFEFYGVTQLGKFQYEIPERYTLPNDLVVEQLLNLVDGEIFIGSHKLTINGDYLSQGGVIGGTTLSNMEMNGTNSNGNGATITFNQTDNANFLNTFLINRPNEVIDIASNLNITNNLSLNSGKLRVNYHDINLVGVSGSSNTNYIITGSAGTVSANLASGTTFNFPVGTFDNYAPVSISPNNPSDFIIRVTDSVYTLGYTGSAITDTRIIHHTWEVISPTDAGEYAMNLTWESNVQGSNFISADAFLSNFDINQNEWIPTSTASTIISSTSLVATGINDFGLFAVSSILNSAPVALDQSFNILEHSPNGYEVGIIEVSDPDPGQLLSINLVNGPVPDPFLLSDDFNIVVSNEEFLEYSINPVFEYDLEVCDNGIPVLCTPFHVTVNLEEDGNDNLKIANFISPNNDTFNDTWKLSGLDLINIDVFIYNNSGNLVYESSGYRNDWDGTSNGHRLPAGIYYYIIRTAQSEHRGSITLLR